ncbi:hypothetical protein ACTXT7_014239 [Hymenolepis weldensis]
MDARILAGLTKITPCYETFATWHIQYRDIYKNTMTDLSNAIRINILFRKFNRSDNYLCSSHVNSMDPADLIYQRMISKLGPGVGDNISLFNFIIREDENVHDYKTNSDASFSFLVSDLLAMLRFDPDSCPSWTRNPMSRRSSQTQIYWRTVNRECST